MSDEFDSHDGDNVVDFTEKRKERRARQDQKPKALNYSSLVDFLAGRIRQPMPGLPHYQQMHEHYLVARVDGQRLPFRIVDEGDTTLTQATADDVAATLSRWYQRVHLIDDDLGVACGRLDAGRGLQETAQRWLTSAPVEVEGMPPPLAETRSGIWSFGKLPPIPTLDWPTFARLGPTLFEMVNRCDRPDILAAWLYCAMTGAGSRKQVLWLHGDANSGKSTLMGGVMARFLGGRAIILTSSQWAREYQWLEGDLVGSVYAVTEEAGRYVLNSDRFKMLTGSRVVMAQRKYQRAVNVEIATRFAFVSNDAPSCGYGDALAKRINVVRIARGFEPSPEQYEAWIDDMAQDMPWLLGYGKQCLAEFGGRLPSQSDVLAEEADEDAASWLAWIDETFVITNDDADSVPLWVMQDLSATKVGGTGSVAKAAYRELRNILLDKYHLKIISSRRDCGQNKRVFVGIRRR